MINFSYWTRRIWFASKSLFSLGTESISRLCWLEINIDMSFLCLRRWLNDSYLISDSSPSSGSNANTDLQQFICDILTIRNSFEWLVRLLLSTDILNITHVEIIFYIYDKCILKSRFCYFSNSTLTRCGKSASWQKCKCSFKNKFLYINFWLH